MAYFIGIDTSTTATKALLMNENGVVLGVASNEYPFETPQPLWSEQDPALWWNATVESIRQVIAKTSVDSAAVKGIGLWTAQMFLMFSLNRPDVWPTGDNGIQRAAARLYGVRSLRRLERLGERFRPHRSAAAWYLWRSLSD